MGKRYFFALLAIAALQSCVGTDIIDDPIVPERINISPRINTLAVGASQTFAVKYSNKYGTEETPKNLAWRTSSAARVTVDATGKATRIAVGATTLYATNGTATDSIVLDPTTAPNDTTFSKMGNFVRVSASYNVAGTARVQTVRGVTQIVTSAGFSVTAGPSIYVLLTNNINGNYSVTPGGNAINGVSAQITPNKLTQFSGALTYNVPAGVNPANYRYVVLYCVLGPVFGYADLN
ncbi:MAG: hypothetical protein RL757_1250 [Bacteroidota bacterium]